MDRLLDETALSAATGADNGGAASAGTAAACADNVGPASGASGAALPALPLQRILGS